MKHRYDDVIYLCRVALGFVKPDNERVARLNKENIYSLARRHSLSVLVAYGIEACGLADEKSREIIAKAYQREILYDNELGLVKSELGAASIWFMPLKGAILKGYYPKPGMRTFSDYDILCDSNRMEDVKDIMVSLGFDVKQYGGFVDDIYIKKPFFNFEMHRMLFTKIKGDLRYKYYEDVNKRFVKTDGFEYAFTDEDFYIYMMAHEYKHYMGSGTGIRSLIDTYVYLISKKLDMDCIKRECEKMGIAEFEDKNRRLAIALMEGRELTDELMAMYEYIIGSGTYGNPDNCIANDMKIHGTSKFRYVMRRIMVPVRKSNPRYEDFECKYPIFYRHKILLIFLPGYRFVKACKRGKVAKEMKALVRKK
ncbi:MAG: nucleotidyltransferase family protein [Lachnospiraceae bacterium]|nr:nucleotidyltransferase family protein [Lachnospiraceae bacterium]